MAPEISACMPPYQLPCQHNTGMLQLRLYKTSVTLTAGSNSNLSPHAGENAQLEVNFKGCGYVIHIYFLKVLHKSTVVQVSAGGSFIKRKPILEAN